MSRYQGFSQRKHVGACKYNTDAKISGWGLHMIFLLHYWYVRTVQAHILSLAVLVSFGTMSSRRDLLCAVVCCGSEGDWNARSRSYPSLFQSPLVLPEQSGSVGSLVLPPFSNLETSSRAGLALGGKAKIYVESSVQYSVAC